MWRCCFAYALLLVLSVSAVRDTSPALSKDALGSAHAGSFNASRLDHGANASVGVCEPDTVSRDTYYCLSVAVPVFPLLKVEGALRIKFDSDHQNCFQFVVTAALGVRITLGLFFVSAHFEVEYRLEQKPRTPTTMCSDVVPTAGIVLSYIFNRVLQYAKGDQSSALKDAHDEIDRSLEKVKQEWKNGRNEAHNMKNMWKWAALDDIGVRNLKQSMYHMYRRASAKYNDLRAQYGKDGPTNIADAVNLAIKAHTEAQVFPNADEAVSNCFDLHTAWWQYRQWTWCYFTNMYTFTEESYIKLAKESECLDMSGEEHKLLWANVKDTSMGLIVEASADLCNHDTGNCIVTIPRDFLAMYPCTSMFIITYMIYSDEAYSGGLALRYINGAVHRQFGSQYVRGKDEEGDDLFIYRHSYDFAADNDKDVPQAEIIFRDVQSKVMNRGGALYQFHFINPYDWEMYLDAYATLLKRLVLPRQGKENDGYAAAVKPNFAIQDTLGVAFSLASGAQAAATTSWCSAPYLEFRALHQYNLNTWSNEKTCIQGRASVQLVQNSKNEIVAKVEPKWCYDYVKQKQEFKFPVKLQVGSYSCVRGFVKRLLGDPEASICINVRSLSFALVNRALKDLMREMRGIGFRVSGRQTQASVTSKLSAILRVIRAGIVTALTIISENALLGLGASAVNAVIGSLTKAMPAELTSECMHYSRQEIELTEVWSPPKGKKPEDALKTPVLGYYDCLQLHVAGVTVKAIAGAEAQFSGLLPASPEA